MVRTVQRLACLMAVGGALTVSCSADQGRRAGTERPTSAATPSSRQVATDKPAGGRASDASCPVTVPIDAAVPPVVSRESHDWYGHDDLWVSLGFARPDPDNFARLDGSYRLKYGSVTLDNGKLTSRFGPPAVEARRLDGPGTATVDVGGYGDTGSVQFWPTVIDFSDRGCWLVTSSIRKTTVRFVVKVL